MTGLIELIGIILLFGFAPICAWKLWVQLDYEEPLAESPLFDDPQPAQVGYLYDQLAS
jgi:hypothetical protein